jgi:uncharacterized protein YdaU (DUF1376 family)
MASVQDSVPWVRFFADRHAADVTDFTVPETAAYFRLLLNQMMYGALPREESKLRRIARLSEKEWRASREALSEKFGPDWRHERVAQDRDEAVRSVRQHVEAGRKGGLKRRTKRRFKRRLSTASSERQATLKRAVLFCSALLCSDLSISPR